MVAGRVFSLEYSDQMEESPSLMEESPSLMEESEYYYYPKIQFNFQWCWPEKVEYLE
jgi:hypothetical protein